MQCGPQALIEILAGFDFPVCFKPVPNSIWSSNDDSNWKSFILYRKILAPLRLFYVQPHEIKLRLKMLCGQQAYAVLSRLRKLHVEQPINNHAGHRDIHPDGPGPAGDFFVEIEPAFERASERHDDHRENDRRADRVREEQHQINRAKPRRVFEAREAVPAEMISEIRHEKNR